MPQKDLYLAIETLEKEKTILMNDTLFRKLCILKSIFTNVKSGDFRSVIKIIKDKYASSVIKKRGYEHHAVNVIENNHDDYEHCKIAIYTVVLGSYDRVPIPLVSFPNADYFLFVDDPEKYASYENSFIVKKIPTEISRKGFIEANRYLKFHPSLFLNGYDYAIYVDGNVRIISDVRHFINYCTSETGIAMHAHRERDCVYDEAEVCCLYRRGNKENIKKQMSIYEKEGFPHHYGMNEATVIVSDLRNPISIELLDAWWNEFVSSMCKRDQLIWPFVLWKRGISLSSIGCLGNNIYENYKLEIIRHEK